MNKKIILAICVVISIIIIIVAICNNTDSNEKTYLYEENGLFGLENDEGKKVTEAKYNKIIKIDNVGNMYIVNINSKYGLINSSGKEVIEVEYDNIVSDEYNYDYSKIGYILSQKTKEGYKFGYANDKGKIILDCEYEEVRRVSEYKGEDIYLILKENGRYGILKNNKFVVDLKYQDIFYNDSVDRFIVEKNGKYGVLDRDGKEIIKPEYTMFGIDEEGIFFLDNNKTIYYDANGKLLRVIEREK